MLKETFIDYQSCEKYVKENIYMKPGDQKFEGIFYKIDDKEYDTDNMTEAQIELLNVLQQNTVIANQLDHQIQCVRAIGKVKLEELAKSLDVKKEKKT